MNILDKVLAFRVVLIAFLGSASIHSIAALPSLNLQREGSGLKISWVEGVLESASQVEGPWVQLPAATSPYTILPQAGSAFFRVRPSFLLEVLRLGDGGGVVHSVLPGIECGTTCRAEFLAGTRVTLQAVPEAGSVFGGWTGACTGKGPCEIVMDSSKTVSATFTRDTPVTTGFKNGDFEQGPSVGWLQQPGNLIYTAAELGVPTYSGHYAAWIGFDRDNRRSAAIGQRVTLPSVVPIYLNYALWLYSEELCDPPWWDTFGLYVDGEAIVENSHLCRGNTGGDGWRRISTDLSAYAGRTVLIGWEISSVDTLASVGLIDNVFISDQPW